MPLPFSLQDGELQIISVTSTPSTMPLNAGHVFHVEKPISFSILLDATGSHLHVCTPSTAEVPPPPGLRLHQ